LKDSDNEKYLGGELAMWTDEYCENRQCWNEEFPNYIPKAYWMFQPEYDQEFTKSILGMVYVIEGLGNITINHKYRQINVCNINIACVFLLQYYRKGNIYCIVQY